MSRSAFRADLAFEPGVAARDLPLTQTQIRRLFVWLRKETRDDAEVLRTVESLGAEPTGLALSFCGDPRMRQIHRDFRKIDRATDILSFPSVELPQIRSVYTLLPARERSLGDLVVSLEAVERGALRGRRSAAEELLEVLVHGFLHLWGHDHVLGKGVGPARARRMRQRQADLYRAAKAFIFPGHGSKRRA